MHIDLGSLNPQAWAAIIGIFMPVVVSLAKRPEWTTWLKVGLTCAVCLVVGAGTVWVSAGEIALQADAGQILESMATAFMAATVVYKTWFGATPLNAELTKLPWG
jgi:threonine/homoserine/homoserine lactone efflux protein